MPNPIKYTTGTETLALKKGNFYIGTGDVGKGPSDTTGYYQGPNVPSGGYVIYLNKEGAPGGLSYHSAANDAQLIAFTNNLAGQSYTTVNECLVYYAGQNDKVVLNRDYEGIVTDGLVLNVDAGFTPSYPRSGTTWSDVGGSNNGTLTNGPTFNSDNGGSIIFDGVNDFVGLGNSQLVSSSSYITLESWVSVNSFQSYTAIISRSQNSPPFGGYQLSVNNDSGINKFDFAVNLNGSWNTWVNLGGTFGSSLSTGIYYHVVGTYDGTGISMYLNGSLISKKAATGNLQYGASITSTNIALNVGNASSYLNAKIANVKVYNRALSQTEVTQNFNALRGRYGI